jgi:hypothetical protein
MKDVLDLIKREGDTKEWMYTCKNGISFTCYIRRVPRSGHLCGYVHLTTDSDYYGYEYDDIPVHCHGGLTYASEHDNEWVIGFDCAHYGDSQPFYNEMEWYSGGNSIYRDMEFVTKECQSICEQVSTKSKSHQRTHKINELI